MGPQPDKNAADGWTEDRVAKLIHNHNLGLSAAQVGMLLGVSRNAIIGKIHRLGLIPHTHMMAVKTVRPPKPPRREPRRASAPKVAPQPMPMFVVIEGGVDLVDLARTACRWPLNDPPEPADTKFCGSPSPEGSSFCVCHRAQAYSGVTRRPIERLWRVF